MSSFKGKIVFDYKYLQFGKVIWEDYKDEFKGRIFVDFYNSDIKDTGTYYKENKKILKNHYNENALIILF